MFGLIGITVSKEFSFLCGYSYAWRVGYKPTAFNGLEKVLIIKSDGSIDISKNPGLIEQIMDSYGKLGFLFLSRDYIRTVNGKIRGSHVYVYYHLYNFIYDCKSYLDSVAVMLNDFYSIGKTGGDVDFKHSSFRCKVIQKEPKLEKIIKKYEDWFVTVAYWRDNLIHRFSSPIGWSRNDISLPSQEDLNKILEENPPVKMLVEPQPLLSANFAELKKKYGEAFREIDPFCKEWIDKACDFYDQVCNIILEILE